MPLICSTCTLSFKIREFYISHLKSHLLSTPFLCKQGNCIASFYDFTSLNRHLRVHHQENEVNNYNNAATEIISTINTNKGADLDEGDEGKNVENNESIDDNIDNYDGDFLKIRKKAFLITMSMKAKSRISESVLNEVLSVFNDFIAEIVDIVLVIADKILKNEENSNEMKDFSSKLKTISHPFDFIKSKYKQEKELNKTGKFNMYSYFFHNIFNIFF